MHFFDECNSYADVENARNAFALAGTGLGCPHVSSTTSTNSRDSNTSSESGLISIIQQQGVMSASTPMFGVFRLSPDQSTQTNNGFSVFTQPLIVNKAQLPLVQ